MHLMRMRVRLEMRSLQIQEFEMQQKYFDERDFQNFHNELFIRLRGWNRFLLGTREKRKTRSPTNNIASSGRSRV